MNGLIPTVQNGSVISNLQFQLLISFVSDLEIKGTSDKRIFSYWADRLDGEKVPFQAQNKAAQYFHDGIYKDRYFINYLKHAGFVIQN